jgi:hypothetical protein
MEIITGQISANSIAAVARRAPRKTAHARDKRFIPGIWRGVCRSIGVLMFRARASTFQSRHPAKVPSPEKIADDRPYNGDVTLAV